MVVKYVARVLSLLWLAWWVYSSIIVLAPDGMRAVLANSDEVFACVIYAIGVALAWRWDVVGGIWLLLGGLIAPFFFRITANDSLTFIVAASVAPILLGILFLISWRQDEKSRVKHYSHTPGIGK